MTLSAEQLLPERSICSASRLQGLHGLQVITEDSDMLAYGCPHVLFKMDKTGIGQEVCMARLPEARSPSFVGFSRDMFLEACFCGPHLAAPCFRIGRHIICILQIKSRSAAAPCTSYLKLRWMLVIPLVV